jgi:multiple sugar transport system substrate-binding protein
MTWNHPRGLDPLVAHAREYEKQHGVRITWDARSLEDFEAFPLDDLAAKYDLMVIDHPHVGMAAASGCLLPFDPSIRFDTVGRSHESYNYEAKQWALAIDAAAQVSARRAEALDEWPATWYDVLTLAQDGRHVLCPLAPVHALMSFFTICADIGHPCATSGRELVDRKTGDQALQMLGELADMLPRECFNLNPIGVFEKMVSDDTYIYAPLVYGYVSYAREGFRGWRLEFGDLPGMSGSTLGGTGVAVSAKSPCRDAAVAVAIDLASPATQRGLYASAGGQPAHRDAWNDAALNDDTHDFFRGTLATLDKSYVRPRFDGYIAFQQAAGELVAAEINPNASSGSTIDRLNQLFAQAQHLT